MSERAAWVALSSIPGLGPARFRALLEVFGSALAAIEAGAEAVQEAANLPSPALDQVTSLAARLQTVEEDIVALEGQGIGALTWRDQAYPARLLGISSPPPVLWWKASDWSTQPEAAAAVVGSREVTEEGTAEAAAVAEALASAGVAVVSGLAAGIDAAAHEAALSCRGPTVGVCGCGLMAALARGASGLAGRLAESGALCSELAPNAHLSPKTLYARDRIIAGLADAVIVVEARAAGGAVHTAKSAQHEGRPVLVIAWPDGHPAEGNRQLLAEGATAMPPGADALSSFVEAIGGQGL